MDDDVLFDVRKLFIARKNVDGKLFPYLKSGRKRRNRRHRRVDLLEPVAQDFREQRMRTGRRRELLIARADGTAWRKHDWDNWRERVWQPLAVEVGLGRYVERKGKPPLYQGAVPYDLRASFVSLLVWEGRTMLEVAARPATASTYARPTTPGSSRATTPPSARAPRPRSERRAKVKDPPWTSSGENTQARMS